MNRNPRKGGREYRVPRLWNCWDYGGPLVESGREVIVEPRAYLQACIAWIDEHSTLGEQRRTTGRSLSQLQAIRAAGPMTVREGNRTRRAGDWIRRQSIYGMMVRTATAWDHDGDGKLSSKRVNELGTFLKSILLLPHARRMGIGVLYLLPIAKNSRLFRKGELGCPYSAKNFLQLDAEQFDNAFGHDFGNVNDQFELFVDCAHRLGMRVMLDVAPRTASRDSDWILEHPEWFYWIDRREESRYASPRLPNVTYVNPIPGRLDEIYDSPAVREHLRKFRHAPNVTHRQEWKNFARDAKARPPTDLLAAIARRFGVVTPPGFSDCINDPQPPWSDVTYLRLFMDHPTEAAALLPDPNGQPPYVLFDTAKASLFEGRKPNRTLWERLAAIIPFYQRFGVDGARVDMAHALPHRLERMILEAARKRDADFCFLAEDLGMDNHAKIHKAGYNILLGPAWYNQPRGDEGLMHNMLAELPRLKVPIQATAETSDTPRAAVRKGRRRFSMQAMVVNHFLPNGVPFIHSGVEVFERQPLNLGLDLVPPGRRALPKSDAQYGKLAFFDKYSLHWDNAAGERMTKLIARLAEIRKEFNAALTNPRAYFAPKLKSNRQAILATGFRLGRGRGSLLMLANLNPRDTRRTVVTEFAGRALTPEVLLTLQHADVSTGTKSKPARLNVNLAPGAAIVVRV
jgi:hypothetical protein